MNKHIKELESEEYLEEHWVEMQVAMNFIETDISKEIQALRASKGAMDGELWTCTTKTKAYKVRFEALAVQIKVCIVAMANCGLVQMQG